MKDLKIQVSSTSSHFTHNIKKTQFLNIKCMYNSTNPPPPSNTRKFVTTKRSTYTTTKKHSAKGEKKVVCQKKGYIQITPHYTIQVYFPIHSLQLLLLLRFLLSFLS